MRVIAVLLFSWTLIFNAFSQESAAQSIQNENALENILKLSMDVSICDKLENSVWDLDSTKLTMPGKPVTMKLEGNSIRIMGSFTPYYSGDSLMILAQTQVYLAPPLVEKNKYFSSFETLSISPGEIIHYFPLGQDTATELNLSGESSEEEDTLSGQMVPEKPPVPQAEREKEEDKKTSMYYILIKLKITPYTSESGAASESP